jgi:hypothetical protein
MYGVTIQIYILEEFKSVVLIKQTIAIVDGIPRVFSDILL